MGKNNCKRCVSFVFTFGLTALFLWISLRSHKPTYSIEEFYVPALNKTAGNDTPNTTIAFKLKIKNKNKEQGVYYDAINITLYYGENQSSSSIGNLSIPPFYQGHEKTAHRKEAVQAKGVPWEVVSRAGSNNIVVFRMDLETKIRFKILRWKTGHHDMKVAGTVTVNDEGKKSTKKGIKLRSAATEHVCYRPLVWISIIVVSYLLL